MTWWTIAIYSGAAVIALSGLFTLMTSHRQRSLERFFEEELQRRQQEALQKPDLNSEPETETAGRNRKAA